MILLIGGRKGGSGKSTITMNLATLLASEGKDVIIVDADMQSSSAEWATERGELQKEKPEIFCVQRTGKIHNMLKDLNKRYEYVLVDPAGRDSEELRSAMIVADILLIPVRPSQLDLNTLPQMQDIISQSKIINETLNVLSVLSMCPTNPIINETKEAKEFLEELPDIHLLNSTICDRKIYRDCTSEGLGVIESDNLSASATKAKNEIKSLLKEILNGN